MSVHAAPAPVARRGPRPRHVAIAGLVLAALAARETRLRTAR